ncbi:serine/threonine-protein kinase RIO3 [Plutella xylostella]|uniref:serine/threonine-protein kinase RIO3 n=1 Tax=Plutella xylostella TaxID=51655 RepID=UPI0020329320|nr:serine/threonine-protein kinase RIO3 [Plutella xylostella]
MSNPWKRIAEPVVVQNFSEIMSEEVAKGLQVKEDMRFAEIVSDQHIAPSEAQEAIPAEVLKQIEESNAKGYCDSDAIIAKVLQCQFDKEYDDEIKLIEKKKNGDAKVSISFDNYRHVPSSLAYDSESEDEDVYKSDKKDWDRFETNEKEFASLPKRGYKMKEGEMVTKHDSVINGRRNACRVMAFPPEFCTGDGAGFDMKLPNTVFNSLKAHSRWDQARRHKMLDRKESQATAVLGIDERTKLILFKLINNGMLEQINGVISTGKESVVLHANSDPAFPDMILPKECAIKVFKTTLNEFKTRDKYIEADYRFKDRFSKQNPRKIVHMWAEKEMHNMMRLQKIGVNCPDMICLKKHVLVMSFIGKDNKPAPKIKDIILKHHEWTSVYEEVVGLMHKMFTVGHMIHADLSEYNILWHERKCWIIDVSQSVEPDHPHGLQFLLRDCRNISNFFEKKGVPNVMSAEEIFKSITGFEEIDVNLLDGVHPTFNALASRFEIEPDDNRNVSYPFDYCWSKSNEGKPGQSRTRTKSDQTTSDESEEDEFDEMWEHSLKQKMVIDSGADFGNPVKLDDEDVSKAANISEELKVPITKDEDKSSSGIDENK